MKSHCRIAFSKAQDYAASRLQQGFATFGMGFSHQFCAAKNPKGRMSQMGHERLGGVSCRSSHVRNR
jgi:hypothetical protein